MGLDAKLLQGLDDLGFESPTPIQAQSIPHLLQTRQDLIALAQTGTGKTAAFSLPLIQQIDTSAKHVQAIVLCPTRELAIQITKDIDAFTKHMKKLDVLAVYGGESIVKQMTALKKGVQIVVGTPGRVCDLIGRNKLKLENVDWLVLDEADEMLNMGFKDDLDLILGETPDTKQTLLFSATMPKGVAAIAKKYMDDPQEIKVERSKETAAQIEHVYYMSHAKDRYEVLRRLADMQPDMYGIVFCRTRRETDEVAQQLSKDGYRSEGIHGDHSQQQRDRVMKRFRNGELQMLVATDVAARGIDVSDLTHVIHYSLPDTVEAYVHRSGRTGRAKKSGTSISLINMREQSRMRAIEKHIGQSVERKHIPQGKDVCAGRLMSVIEDIKNFEVDQKKLAQFMPMIEEQFEGMDIHHLLQQFMGYQFQSVIDRYNNASDLNVNEKHSGGRREKADSKWDRMDDSDKVVMSVNLGSRDKFTPKQLFHLVNTEGKLKNVNIGRINIDRSFTDFEIDKGSEKELIKTLDGIEYFGFDIRIKKSTKTTVSGSRGRSRGGSRGGRSRRRR